MQEFLRLLREHGDDSSPPPDLVTLAGKLCRDFQDKPVQVLHLVEAILNSKHRWALVKNEDVTMVCVHVLIQQEQHLLALQILKVCHMPGGSQDLVELWNDIHYQLTMKRLGVTELTAAQRFRCRKRNPPPLTFCPEGPKNRNFLPEIRSCLQDFARGVTAYPKKAQLEKLASETGLTTEQVYSWFANYRRHKKGLLRHVARAQEATSEVSQATDHVPEPAQLSGNHCESLTVSQCSGHPEWRVHHPASLMSKDSDPGPGLCPPAAGSSDMLDSSMNAPESWMMPLTLPSFEEVSSHSLEAMPALPAMPAPLSTMELSQPLPFSQVQRADDQASWDAFWGATMLLEFSEGALGRNAGVETEQHTE
ncbi:anomalous homeobox protein-like [Arvicanthis niloticus]|uniref:anomalous homeobox protein-like n=1 Tax=Arvicanthis niloticus TaxID=61156 RepID=UPI0014863E3C|nr:anomalous homeobox protein-like [Arvicanthis niloticus]